MSTLSMSQVLRAVARTRFALTIGNAVSARAGYVIALPLFAELLEKSDVLNG